MSATAPVGAVIEIIERTNDPSPALIVPNEVRINGIALWTPTGESIKVHEIAMDSEDLVKVTLTLFAQRVTIGHEQKVEDA